MGPPEGREGFIGQEGAAGGGRGTRVAGARGRARPGGRRSPLQGGQPEALGAELDEGAQVRLAHAAYGVDVGAGAVVLGQVAEEAGDKGNTGVRVAGLRGAGPANAGRPGDVPGVAGAHGGTRRRSVPEEVWGGRWASWAGAGPQRLAGRGRATSAAAHSQMPPVVGEEWPPRMPAPYTRDL